MEIIFDRKTKLRKMQSMIICFPEIIEKAKNEIKDTLPHYVFDFFSISVADFLRLQENIMPEKVQKFLSKRTTTFYDYIKLVNTFEQGAKAFEQILVDTTIQAEADEESARAGLLEITTEEAMLTFLLDFYKLQSLEQAQKMTLYEYITARKISFNNSKFQKNLIAIQKIKI
jgi:hypothetical protein